MSTQVRPQIKPAPVRKSIFVNAPRAHAFEVFTSGIGRWWPKTHKIGPADLDRPVERSWGTEAAGLLPLAGRCHQPDVPAR